MHNVQVSIRIYYIYIYIYMVIILHMFFKKYYVIWYIYIYIEQHRYSMMICVTLCNYIQCSLKLPPWGGSWKLFDLRTTSVSWAMRRPGAPWRTTPCTNGCGSCSASWRGTAWCWTRRPMRHSPNWAYAAEICWDLRSLGSKLGVGKSGNKTI